MSKKLRLAILFGGKSAEHEVSLQSAKNVYDAIDKNKYDVVLIGIDKQGKWHLNDASKFLLQENNPKLIKLYKGSESLALIPGKESEQVIHTLKSESIGTVDVVFPLLHGPMGEDGTVQGLLKLADIPFVGAGVLGSAIGMDKDVMKRLLRAAGIPVVNFLSYKKSQSDKINILELKEKIGIPCFVKPVNMGSSVGISKAHDEAELKQAIETAFLFDTKIIVEQYIKGRELECSVLGNDDPIASIVGEVIAQHEFYDYEAKYIDENGAQLIIPAQLEESIAEKIQRLAIESFKTIECAGMARVDFFLTENNNIFVNELNTIPGFTKISMYPKLWEASGISYSDLIDRLIRLAVERFENEKKIKFSYK